MSLSGDIFASGANIARGSSCAAAHWPVAIILFPTSKTGEEI